MDTVVIWKVASSDTPTPSALGSLDSREFPFEQLLVLWDSLFAEDPDFTLVDYICVAMLLRIRWERTALIFTAPVLSRIRLTNF